MDHIVFVHSKGASTRRKLMKILFYQKTAEFINTSSSISKELSISKVATKKHVDYLHELGYIDKINPSGKPIYLRLTPKGNDTFKNYIYY